MQTLLSGPAEYHKTPYLGAGKTGSDDYLPVAKIFSLSEELCKEYE